MWERACPRRRPFRQRCINCHTGIAGKPTPTFDLWCDQNTLPDKDPLCVGLPAMAPVQAEMHQMTHRYRRPVPPC